MHKNDRLLLITLIIVQVCTSIYLDAMHYITLGTIVLFSAGVCTFVVFIYDLHQAINKKNGRNTRTSKQ